MENEQLDPLEQQGSEQESTQEKTGYVPRPLWQRIAAWVGLALFVLVIVLFYIHIMRGGL